MDKKELASKKFNSGYNCAQSVLTAFSDEYGLNNELAYKLSCGFGAGMGRLQNTCGAVTGANMVIGLKYGKANDGEAEKREKTYSKVLEFAKEFEKRNKSINCKEIINCDLQTKEGQKYFKENNLMKVCTKCVSDSVEILQKIL